MNPRADYTEFARQVERLLKNQPVVCEHCLRSWKEHRVVGQFLKRYSRENPQILLEREQPDPTVALLSCSLYSDVPTEHFYAHPDVDDDEEITYIWKAPSGLERLRNNVTVAIARPLGFGARLFGLALRGLAGAVIGLLLGILLVALVGPHLTIFLNRNLAAGALLACGVIGLFAGVVWTRNQHGRL